MFRSCPQMTRNFQSDVVSGMISIEKPKVRLPKDLLGSEVQKNPNHAVTPGENSTPELFFLKIILEHPKLSPIPYESSENTLETLETPKTSQNHDFFMQKL